MFSLKSGCLNQYKSQFISLLSEVDDSKYIFYADVSHAYEDSSYSKLTDDELQEALNKDLENFGVNLTVVAIISSNDSSSGGWPLVRVKNTRPMTIRQFFDTINEVYFAESFDWLVNNNLDSFGVIA